MTEAGASTGNVRMWTHVEKLAWGDGPWLSEPDKVQWVDEATNLDCLAVRNPDLGHWCGYVGVAQGHPAFKQHYDSVEASVHGGLTYADKCQEEAQEGHGICHIPAEGRPHDVWWLGFDCAHWMDLSPGMRARQRSVMPSPFINDRDVYRDLEFVKAECADLAKQLAGMR